ncbi:hypothetical protein OIDMADRAFT_18762, partial [Oidiodendron maius Zn]
MQAAIRAAGQASPVSVPPPPPNAPPSLSVSTSSAPLSAPPPPASRQQTHAQPQTRPMLDPSSYTLSSNGTSKNPSPSRNADSRRLIINDTRWKFQDESILPKPREFIGGSKRYRAGRGSSVPLDLGTLE